MADERLLPCLAGLACLMVTECGRELQRLLEERDISLREAARRANCSAAFLSNVSHGRKSLTPSVAARLDEALGTRGTFAAYALSQPGSQARAAGLPDDRPEGGAQNLEAVPLLPGGISPGNVVPVIAALGEILPGYIQADRLVGSAALILPLRSHIATVERACEVARGADREKVLAFASRFTEFCGWANQDAGDLSCAMRLTSRALDYALELGDQRTIAYTLMRKASIATETGLPGHGAGMASAALARAGALTPRLRAVLFRQRAYAAAALGDPAAALRDADAAIAEAVAGASQDEDDRAPYCSPMYAQMEAGAVHLLLGSPAAALAVLERSRSAWSDHSQVRDRALCLSRLAMAYADAGERDQARAAADDALTATANLASGRVRGQLAQLAGKLAAWGDDPETAAILRGLRGSAGYGRQP